MKVAATPYEYFNARIFNAKSENILNNDFRFNAEYYEGDNSIAISNEIEFYPLSEIASVVFPGIFKRYLVEDIKYGIKFLTTSDIMMLEPDTDKILSEHLTSNLPIYRVREHTLLVSRSGTIGNTIYVDDRLKDFAITEDALRVKPYDEKNIGLIYFYFTSEYGNGTITGKKSGAVIDHIYEEDLLKLPIPRLHEQLCEHFFENYLKVKSNRENADKIIKEARSLVLQYNNLPPLSDIKPETIDKDGEVEIRMTGLDEFENGWRLDSHFYNSKAKQIVNFIEEKAKSFSRLKDICEDIVLGKRFKRNYVESDHGTPFIGSKNILQIRPSELKYLSNSEISFMDDLMLKSGMILIACSGSLGGTFGKTSLVHKNFEGYAASQHILRVVSNDKVIDSGYLYAYLSSDYGYFSITRYRWGALIDEIDDEDMAELIIPICDDSKQNEIGDLVRKAYELRAEAIKLEDEAQKLLTQALTQA
ncbi:MAG: restriction endonuclease subunit S [Haliscomenobacter sp.]|nr:restriction endonuclease subunit S [Haliscomenobacter sp.]